MIVFIIVIYNIKLSDCITLKTLRECLHSNSEMEHRVLVLDNSDSPSEQDLFGPDFEYYRFHQNIGLARAYKYGLEYCHANDAKFMVTLDQDSEISIDYIDAVFKNSNLYRGQDVALCPRIFCGDRQISPYSYNFIGFPRYDSKSNLHAINSFSVYAVSSLNSPGVIDEFYWLDALDFSIYENLHRRGTSIIPMGVKVQHNLSLLQGSVSPVRLSNIAFYESAYLFEYCGPLRLMPGLTRLLFRVARRINFLSRSNGFAALLQAIKSGAIKGLTRRMKRHFTVETKA